MSDPCQSPGTHYMGCPCWELQRNTALEAAQHRIEALELALETRCAQPGVAKCAREWEADKQRAALEAVGLAEEFPFGCDAIEHVAEALVACRADRLALSQRVDELDNERDRLRAAAFWMWHDRGFAEIAADTSPDNTWSQDGLELRDKCREIGKVLFPEGANDG